MMLLNGAVLLLSAATAMTVPSHVPSQGLRRVQAPQPAVTYTTSQIESYLTTEQVEYIRPGYKITLVSFDIPADGKPVATVKLTDDMDQPLDRDGKITPGACSASFILAWYDAAHRDYVSYTTRVQKSPITQVSATQAAADSNGQWTMVELGTYTYKFRTALPAGFDRTKTHTVGIYGARNLTTIIGKTYYSNVLKDFRPDGAQVTEVWDAFKTATCNACHDPLALHGGSRREVKLCVLCHNKTQSLDPDTGNSVQMAEMIHKIHDGPNLDKGYTIIGNQQSVNDFSHTTYPQDIRNCTTCHKADAAEGHIWYSNPSRQACGSCHDSITWETGANHDGGAQADDSACADCHRPEGEFEFDASVKGAHTLPTKSTQLKGLKFEVTSIANTAPGQKPVVTFKVTNGDGTIVDPTKLNRVGFIVGGPNTDYSKYFRENLTAANTVASGDSWIYTFNTAIPADATGSWTLAADVYRNITLNPGPTGTTREAAPNPIFPFVVTDTQVTPRREAVELAKCNKCHDVLALHGGSRTKVAECNICHNPTATASVAAGGANENISMKWMIHRIHTGEELDRDYVIGDTSFHEVLYPGDRRNCEACHKTGTYGVPLPDDVLPTTTPRDYVTLWQPASASCVSCHDTVDAAAHAYVNTAPFGESCASCHGADREFSVTKVHAR